MSGIQGSRDMILHNCCISRCRDFKPVDAPPAAALASMATLMGFIFQAESLTITNTDLIAVYLSG